MNNLKEPLKYLLIAAIVIIVGSYFRLYPFLYRISSASEEKATLMVFSQIRTDIEQNVNRLYPGLNDDQKRLLADQKFSEITSQKRKQIQQSIFTLAQKIYGRELIENPDKKEPEIYLPDSDSYYFYGMTKQLAENKQIMQKRKGAEYFNDLMLAPLGYWEKINLHPFVGFWTYQLMRMFNPQISLMLAISFLPVFLTILSALLFLLLLKHLGIHSWACLIGGSLFILAPIFLRRSFFGWYDNDIYNIFFPLLILWLTFLGIENAHHQRKRILFALLTALSIVCYAFFWQGWVYLFCVILAAGILVTGVEYFILKKEKKTSNVAIFFGITFVTIFIGVVAAFGLNQFFFLFQEGWSVLNDFFLSSNLSLWPDIYMSVGELNRTSWSELFDLAGNAFWFLIAIGGSICFFLDLFHHPSKKTSYKMLLVFIFFFSSLLLALQAQRFVLLLVVPLSLLAAYGFEKIFIGLQSAINRFNPYPPWSTEIKTTLCVLIVVSFAIAPILKADDLASRIRPIFNEAWERALVTLQEKTPHDSIINTWWPPGHFIKAIAQRRVTFDGATINVPQAFWMARALYSPSEKKTLGILRMLNTSANKASEFLLNKGKKLSEVVDIIEYIVVLPQNKAKAFLMKTLNSQDADTLINLTHGQPPPSYVFLYNDMIESNIGIGFAARWNIKKLEDINANPSLLKQVRKLNSKDYISLLWDTQGGLLRYSEILNQINEGDEKISFQNGIAVDLKNLSVTATSPKFGTGVPQHLFVETATAPIKKEFLNATLPYSVFVFQTRDHRYACILMDEIIADSIMAKLYFWGAKSFRYIEPFVDEHDLTEQTQLFAFKIDWETFINDLEKNP